MEPVLDNFMFPIYFCLDWSQGMLAIFRCRIFCQPVCYPKIQRL